MSDKALKGISPILLKQKIKEAISKKEINIPKRQKRIDELDPPKPIKGGGFAPIGKIQAFKKGGKI